MKTTVGGSDISGVDFGFSFNAISHVGDGDDDGGNDRTVQGSLRQAIQNANAQSGQQTLSVWRPAPTR